ncbi:tRNA (adenine(22)-N(1))-methyltransferase [Desulforhopalus sp. 52FAK]
MKLGKRLKKIESMVTSDYTHIWDCCCDHGLLGATLISRHAAPHIHFVDVVPDLMCELQIKLQRYYSNSSTNWKIHCLDLEALSLDQYEGKSIVIIAGVGGDLITQFVTAIHQRQPTTPIDFILCPVYHQFTLRQQLIELNFSLNDEVLIEENRRFYEILLVSSPSKRDDTFSTISPVGELIWKSDTDEQSKIATDYLNKTLNHFQRIKRGGGSDVQYIIDAYLYVAQKHNIQLRLSE